jgi:hypothetical protein
MGRVEESQVNLGFLTFQPIAMPQKFSDPR